MIPSDPIPNCSPRIFDVIADRNRRRILALLAAHDELCVCELTAAIGESQPKISRHLAVMKDAGLVLPRRAGIWMHYRLAPLPVWAAGIVAQLTAGAVPEFPDDLARLRLMAERPDRCAVNTGETQ